LQVDKKWKLTLREYTSINHKEFKEKVRIDEVRNDNKK